MESSHDITLDDIHNCYDRLKEFFPKFLELANEELKSHGVSQRVLQYYSYVIQYNIQGGKMIRGVILVSTVKALCGTNISDQLWDQTLIVAWCLELLQTSFLVADDIMDQSTKRRSNTCWYLVPTIGVSNAINDVMFMYTLIYRILFNVLNDNKMLLDIVETFNRVSMTTIIGQHLDSYDSNNENMFQDPDYSKNLFTEICKNKTSYYSFFMPIKLGMILSGIEGSNLFYSRVESISFLLGTLFQAQDDYLDCYGDPEKLGKTGTDIQTKKCSWLLTQALSLASEEEKRLIRENMGFDDQDKVAVVKGVYADLHLDKVFAKYSSEMEEETRRKIEEIENQGIKEVLKWCLNLIRKRSNLSVP